MEKQKLTNLHDFQHQLFLGFLAQYPLQKTQIDISFISGQPVWLYEPNPKMLTCKQCTAQGETLTFLGQIFCPLNAGHCYNRIMYFLGQIKKCRRTFKCIKQQTDKNWQPNQTKEQKRYKTIDSQSFQIQSDSIQRKEILKIINRSKIEVEQQIILEQQDENDDQQGEQIVTVQKITGEQMINKLSEIQMTKKNKEYTDKQIEEINKKFESLKIQQKDEKQPTNQISPSAKDFFFEQYIRTIKALNSPIMIYSNIPIPYNKTPLNPKHTCKHCNSKLELEIQITQKVLLFNKNLALLDWGSIFVYACTSSCQQSVQECVVVQYQFDAVSEEEITKLKRAKKTRKKNQNKSLSKEKKRQKQEEDQKQKIKPQLIKNFKQQNKQDNEQQGDWD